MEVERPDVAVRKVAVAFDVRTVLAAWRPYVELQWEVAGAFRPVVVVVALMEEVGAFPDVVPSFKIT